MESIITRRLPRPLFPFLDSDVLRFPKVLLFFPSRSNRISSLLSTLLFIPLDIAPPIAHVRNRNDTKRPKSTNHPTLHCDIHRQRRAQTISNCALVSGEKEQPVLNAAFLRFGLNLQQS